jgi:hypothetical protein
MVIVVWAGEGRAVSVTRLLLCGLATALFISGAAIADEQQSAKDTSGYLASLGDMMTALQLRHAKLWYAARAGNWPLAEYELKQLDANLKQTTRFYPDTPIPEDVGKQLVAIDDAIKAKNVVGFELSFSALTTACNSCHQTAGREFIIIRRPTFPSPYSNQLFTPAK